MRARACRSRAAWSRASRHSSTGATASSSTACREAGAGKHGGIMALPRRTPQMNKTFVISVVALFVVSMLLGLVVHGMLLHADYLKLTEAGLLRSESDAHAYFVYMLAAHVIL